MKAFAIVILFSCIQVLGQSSNSSVDKSSVNESVAVSGAASSTSISAEPAAIVVVSPSASEDQTAKLKALQDQLDTIKAQISAMPRPMEPVKEEKKFIFFGDFRLRVQGETQAPNEERRRQRLQMRAGFTANVNDSLQVTGRLMTGSSATSGNVTLGDESSAGASRKSVGVDQAFFNYQPKKFIGVQAGKMPLPFYFVGRNQIILDRDITPEGLTLKLPLDLDENWKLTIVGMNSQLRENYDKMGVDLTDSQLNGAQAYLNWKNRETSILVGSGSFAFTAIKDYEPSKFVSKPRDPNPEQGNSTQIDINSGNAVYLNNFDNSEMFVEIKQKIGDVEIMIFSEQVKNTDIELLNKAESTGLGLSYGPVQLTVWNQKVEKDAVMGIFTDSDYADGFTSVKGRIGQLSYKYSSNLIWTYTVYDLDTLIDTDFPTKYKRSQLDMLMTF